MRCYTGNYRSLADGLAVFGPLKMNSITRVQSAAVRVEDNMYCGARVPIKGGKIHVERCALRHVQRMYEDAKRQITNGIQLNIPRSLLQTKGGRHCFDSKSVF